MNYERKAMTFREFVMAAPCNPLEPCTCFCHTEGFAGDYSQHRCRVSSPPVGTQPKEN